MSFERQDKDPNTLNDLLDRAAALYGDRPWMDFQGDSYSFSDIQRRADAMAGALAAMGVGAGDRVATVLDNNVDCITCMFAIPRLGAIWVPVNTAYRGEFLRHQIADCGAAIVIAEADYAERIAAVAEGIPALATIVIRRGAVPTITGGLRAVPLDDCLAAGQRFEKAAATLYDLCMFIYTSGTTGPSKGCMINHGYACNMAWQSVTTSGTTGDDLLWTALPLFHMNAVNHVLMTGLLGARIAIYPHFSLSNFWPEIRRTGATVVSVLGSMQRLIAEAPDSADSAACFGQLRVASGAPFGGELQQKWRERFGVLHMGAPGYGLTEAAMVCLAPLAGRTETESSGRVAPDFEVIIVDDDDVPLPPDSPGEILVRPRRPGVMFDGYWNRPEATLAIMRNMWLHTGDIGRFDADGRFYFMDRKKDYLRRRGENISSHEMEVTFAAHPAIKDVAVHAVFSPMGEDDVKVTCVLNEGAALNEADLCRWSVDRVPYFAVPRYIEFRADLPRNPTGKILKYQLRDEGCTAATWDRETVAFELAKR